MMALSPSSSLKWRETCSGRKNGSLVFVMKGGISVKNNPCEGECLYEEDAGRTHFFLFHFHSSDQMVMIYENVFYSFQFFSSNVTYFLIIFTLSPQRYISTWPQQFSMAVCSSLELCQEWPWKKCLLEPKSCFTLHSLAFALVDHCWYRSI